MMNFNRKIIFRSWKWLNHCKDLQKLIDIMTDELREVLPLNNYDNELMLMCSK